MALCLHITIIIASAPGVLPVPWYHGRPVQHGLTLVSSLFVTSQSAESAPDVRPSGRIWITIAHCTLFHLCCVSLLHHSCPCTPTSTYLAYEYILTAHSFQKNSAGAFVYKHDTSWNKDSGRVSKERRAGVTSNDLYLCRGVFLDTLQECSENYFAASFTGKHRI